MHSKDEEHSLLSGRVGQVSRKPTSRLQRIVKEKWRTVSLCLISNLCMFALGFFASHPWDPTNQTTSTLTTHDHHGHSMPPSKAATTTIINGVEVAGTQCGANWREAKALGCRFDVMASRWYAPECFDQEVVDDMLAEPQVNWNFTWYTDKEHTVVVAPEKVFAGEFDKVYPDNLFHIKHCLHLWRKLHHAVLTGRPVDEDILDYEHTVHCTRMIMEWMDPDFKRHSVTSAESATPFCRATPLGMLGVGN